MTEPEAIRRSKVPFARLWRWWQRQWRRTAVILLVLLALLFVVRAVADLWMGHQLHEEVSRLEKVYGRLDLATLAPPELPAAENRARVERAAASLLVVGPTELAALDRAYRRYVPPAPPEDLRRAVEENQFAIEVARQARRRQQSDWEIDYAHDQANLPRLLDVRNLGLVLAESCRLELDAGRWDQAADAAAAGLAEAASLRQEPSVIIQLIRIALASEQFGCVRDLLARGEPSAALLRDLAAALGENRTSHPFRAAFIGELKFVNHAFGEVETGNEGEYVSITRSPAWMASGSWLWRPLIRYHHLRALRTWSRVVEMESEPAPARQAAVANAAREGNGLRWWQFGREFGLFMVAPGLMRAADSGYEDQSVLNASELAVALRRFRLDRATYPTALGGLVPHYLPQIPIDPFTGRPPEYIRQGTGFELRVHGMPGTGSDLLQWRIPR